MGVFPPVCNLCIRHPSECPWTKALQRPRGATWDVSTASLQRPHLLIVSISCSPEPLAYSRRSWALLPLSFSLMLLQSGNSPPFPPSPNPFSAWLISPWVFRLGVVVFFPFLSSAQWSRNFHTFLLHTCVLTALCLMPSLDPELLRADIKSHLGVSGLVHQRQQVKSVTWWGNGFYYLS